MNPLLQQFLVTVARWALTFCAGFMIKAGILKDMSESEQYIAGGSLALSVLVFSLWSRYKSRLHFLTALEAPPGTTEAEVKAIVKDNGAPPAVSLWLLAAVLCLMPAVAMTGCGTTPQRITYQSAATTTVTVETAIRLYNVAAKEGKTTVEQNQKVKAAYEKYQAAFAVVCDAGAIYAAGGGTNAPAAAALQQAIQNSSGAIQDVLNLVTALGVKL